MVDDSSPHIVVSSLVALIDCAEQVHHILKELASLIPLADTVNTFDNDLVNDLAGVPIDQDDPLVYKITLGPKLNLDGFQHLNTSHYVVQSRLLWLLATDLVH
jgi:hypothetical protein